MQHIKTVADIVQAFGGGTKFARACGISDNEKAMGWNMKRRASIPIKYWPYLIDASRKGEQGFRLTSDLLLKVHTT